jgi:hypothetical protein
MASTRSKCRSLKNLFGISQTALEELKDIDDVIGDEQGQTTAQSTKETEPKKTTVKKTAQSTQKKRTASTTKVVTIAQIKCIKNMATRKKWSEAELNQHCKEKYAAELEKINRAQASECINFLKQAA